MPEETRQPRWELAAGASAAVLLGAMGVLAAMGRGWWCAQGDLAPWSWGISLDYDGDAVLNSGADIVAMGLGYLVATRLPAWASVLIFVATEVALALWIRDSLLLNVLMLLYPPDAIKAWQLGG